MQKAIIRIIWTLCTISIAHGILFWLGTKGIFPEKWIAGIIGQAESILAQEAARWILYGVVGLAGLMFGPAAYDWGVRKWSKKSDVLLLEPTHIYTLVWDPPNDLQIITRPILANGETELLGTRLPVFRIKNLGAEVMHEISIFWKIQAKTNIEETILSSQRVQRFNPSIAGDMFNICLNNGSGAGVTYRKESTSAIKYLAPTIDNETYSFIQIPPGIWACIELLAIATIPDLPLFSTVSFEINAEISCKQPKVKPSKYLVTSRIHSNKPGGTGVIKIPIGGIMREPPEVMAEVRFNVQRLEA